MILTKKIRLVDINPDLLREQLAAAISVTVVIGTHGFDRVSRRFATVALAPKPVVTKGGVVTDSADIGEVRIATEVAMSAADDTAFATTLSAHDQTQLTQEQRREDKDASALAILSTNLQRATWDGLNNLQKFNVLRRGIQLLLRENTQKDLDTDD